MVSIESHVSESNKEGLKSGVFCQGYIIPYPPGVPLAVPGDVFTGTIRAEIARLQRAGVEVFFINS
jgi:arginine/lysine/ornithine decarboxylase